MKNNFNKAFTLVELIVVITILAVLATVAFISFQGYTSSSRDSVRLADLKNVEKQLNIYFTQNNIYPDPATPVSIPTGGTQGELAKSVTNKLGVSEVKDPLTGEYYFYRISENKRKYQIMGFLENGDSISLKTFQNTFAENDIPYSKGDKLGIVLNSDGKTLPTTIDLSTGTYDVIFSNNSQENLSDVSGEDNFIVLKSSDKGFYDESLVGYWDMETFTSDGKLADLSGNNNHGTINDANNSGLATPVNGAMIFDGVDDYIEVADSYSLDITGKEITMLAIVNLDQIRLTRQRIFTKYGGPDVAGYSISVTNSTSNGRYESFLKIDGRWKAPDYDKQVPINQDVFFTTIKDNTNIYTYQNKNLLGKESFPGGELLTSLGGILYIGSYGPSTEFLDGNIKEIFIFNRALSQGEIEDIYMEIQ